MKLRAILIILSLTAFLSAGTGGYLYYSSIKNSAFEEALNQIIEPFYATKPDGMGMGLSINRSIIDAHLGRLWAENNPDRGATFYYTLPIVEGG